jgi:hypothetical protein
VLVNVKFDAVEYRGKLTSTMLARHDTFAWASCPRLDPTSSLPRGVHR